MYSYNEEEVQYILSTCKDRTEILRVMKDDIGDGLQNCDDLEQVEDVTYTMLSYIEALRRSK